MGKFTRITETINYPRSIKAELSTLHSDIITYVIDHFKNTREFKSQIINLMNMISYYVVSGDSMPNEWESSNPLENVSIINAEEYKEKLGDLYIVPKDVIWDVEEVDDESSECSDIKDCTTQSSNLFETISEQCEPTPKEDLYLKAPIVPLFDVTKPWLNVTKDNETYTIYTSLPLIPEVQRDISITTDVNTMTNSDLLNLYPNRFIRTRAEMMYEQHDGLTYDPDIGVVFPIDGFSIQQIRDNIIQYPHFYKLVRLIDGKQVSFYSNIEIDGELHNTLDIWDDLPDSKLIPKTSEFIKEYVIRRYLLERDVMKIKHKYPLFGTLNPFITLFTTANDYNRFGYSDSVQLARKCVESRVSFFQSRNPILRKVYGTNGELHI